MYNRITFVELTDLMAEATSTSKRVCELFLRELFATISQALINGESVKVKGVGTFKVTQVKPRKSVNVTTGEAMEISGHGKLTFTPDKSLAKAVNHPFAQFETVFLEDEVTDQRLAEIDERYPSFFPEEGSQTESASLSVNESGPQSEPEQEPESEPLSDIVETVGQKALAAFGVPVVHESEDIAETAAEPESVSEPEAEQTSEVEPKSEPVADVDAEPEDDFRRPAPSNAYTPTEEQVARHRSRKTRRLLWWILLAALAIGLLVWLITHSTGRADDSKSAAVADSDTTVVIAEPAVITDTITTQEVLSTLADKYYDSQWFWVYIYEENKNIIEDPDNVPPGTAVVIPPAEKYDIDANNPESIKKAQRLSWEILNGK